MKKPYEPLYYRDYLQLRTILQAQALRSAEYSTDGSSAHDEMLFIITHQTYELWFKQILHELDSVLEILAREPLPEQDVAVALHRFQRINKIGPLMLHHIDVLETMTPMDFLDFRDVLYPASGFQSLQFRLIEIKLGLTESQRVLSHLPLDEADKARVKAAQEQPSVFTLVERWLERMPFTHEQTYSFWEEYQRAAQAMFEHDRTMILQNTASEAVARQLLAQMEDSKQSFQAFFNAAEYERLREQGLRRLSFPATQAALFIMLYREYPLLQLPFRFLEAIIEMDELISVWRYRHANMALRMIGSKVGTGSSSGANYLLQATLKHRVFHDFSSLSAFLIPRKSLPELPEEISALLGFVFER